MKLVMKLLSQQIRDLVNNGPASSYAIARQAGISKSAMSLFMNGGRLTMNKLDQLAKVLGVTVLSEGVSTVPRPLQIGRPKQTKAKSMTRKQAQYSADYYAQDAFTNYFFSRRGVWHIEDLDCLLIYNNNPYVNSNKVRMNEMRRIEKRLRAIGIKTLARGGSVDNIDGTNEPYTVTLLLDCSKDRIDEICAIAHEEVDKSFDEMRFPEGS